MKKSLLFFSLIFTIHLLFNSNYSFSQENAGQYKLIAEKSNGLISVTLFEINNSQDKLVISNQSESDLTFSITAIETSEGKAPDLSEYNSSHGISLSEENSLPNYLMMANDRGYLADEWLIPEITYGTIEKDKSREILVDYSFPQSGIIYSSRILIQGAGLEEPIILSVNKDLTTEEFTTTTDNENNQLQGVPDNDMDVDLNGSYSYEPCEFNIFIDASGIQSADLAIYAFDVDASSGEVDEVYINGNYLGTLTGNTNIWSTTVLNVSPSFLNEGSNAKNLVQIYVDATNSGWVSEVDWGKLTITALNNGRIAHYPFNGNANDESGNNHHGTVYGATLTTDRFGVPNSAYAFDGLDDYIEVANDNDFNFTNAFSICAWVKHNTGNPLTFENMIMKGNLQYGLQFQSGNFMFQTRSSGYQLLNSGISPNAADWYFLTAVYDGAEKRIYINGQLENSIAYTQTLNTTSDPLTFGKKIAGDNYFLNGILDDISIYNRDLSITEIDSLYSQASESTVLKLNVFLEGPFNGIDMNTDLYADIPMEHPYKTEPWFYYGEEKITGMPLTDVVDWVLVEIRETAGGPEDANSETVISRQAALLKKDGTIVNTQGYENLNFNIAVTANLYVVVYHRNHLVVMSSSKVNSTKGIYAWDFSSGSNQAYGGVLAHKELAAGIWGMISGDGNADDNVTNLDKNDVWAPQAGESGYKSGDYDLNGNVANPDKNDLWVKNSGMGAQVPGTFQCGDSIVDIRDGQKYLTTLIGDQCWMAQNLNTGIRVDGNVDQADNGIIEKYCYNNDPSQCETYGGLYQWNEIMAYTTNPGARGICPDGWHIPTDSEFVELEGEADTQYDASDPVWNNTGFRGYDAGGNLKETGTLYWFPPNYGATNSSGFTGLPAGLKGIDDLFHEKGSNIDLFTSTKIGSEIVSRRLHYNHQDLGRFFETNLDYGFSLRCVKDFLTNAKPVQPFDPEPENNSSDIATDTVLSWKCYDPDGDSLTYSIYFGLNSNPGLIAVNHADTVFNPGILISDTTYYWKITAFDVHGDSAVSETWSFETGAFTCGSLLADIRDGQTYSTVLIGNQCWMAENLNIGVRIDGANNQADNSTFEKYCYDNDPANCETYGGLYQWDEAMQYVTDETAQGICPPTGGWHIPTDYEWKILEGTVDTQFPAGDPEWDNLGWRGFDAGGNLKETGTTHWNSPNTGATNFSGFTALPGGRRDPSGDFNVIGDYSYWWSASQSGSNRWSRRLHFINVQINRNEHSKSYGFSIRCLKDSLESNHSPNIPSNPYPADGSVDISIDTLLHWSASDPDPGDVLLYNIYFGLENNPPLAATKQFDTVYNPGAMYNDSVYYWKVVAVDIYGDSAVSPVWSFTTRGFVCGDALADPRDGQAYNTVLIGNQCWMAENLNTGTMINGSGDQSDNGTLEKYCYNNDPANCETYGGLYQWDEAMQYDTTEAARGICPDGWHIPADDQWKYLEGTVDSQFPVGDPEWDNLGWRGFDAGGNLKETGTTHWNSPNTGATNLYGFTLLPAGHRLYNTGGFSELGNFSVYWTSSTYSAGYSWRRQFHYNSAQSYRNDNPNTYGYSIRCLKDYLESNQPPDSVFNPMPSDGSIDIVIDTLLSWEATDPESDPLLFDIYFGTAMNPALVASKHNDTVFNPGLLSYDSVYYWKVVAFDIYNDSVVSDLWSFTVKTFVCGDVLGDTRDGKTYETVEIGTQCWMAENINIGGYKPGSYELTNNGYFEKYCYGNSPANCNTYGGLYQWDEAMDYVPLAGAKGICPQGWHIPTDYEWKVLEGTVDTQFPVGDPEWDNTGWRGFDAGKRLKSTSGWYSGGNGTDDYQFTSLPAGYRLSNGNFTNQTENSFYWVSLEESQNNSWTHAMGYNHDKINRNPNPKNYGFSLRCIKNPANQPPAVPSSPGPENGSINITIDTILTWTASDPDFDPMYFSVYLGTEPNPPLVAVKQLSASYAPAALFNDTTYYWSITAFDVYGDSTAGPVWSFSTRSFACGDALVDHRDGQAYNTVLIGNQCWMAENLNIGTMINGSGNQADNSTLEKYCYDNTPSNCVTYGGLYQWDEAMQYVADEAAQGICPNGWHIPTDDQWKYLEGTVDSQYPICDPEWDTIGWRGSDAGGNLKETGTVHWNSPNTGATNLSGFTGLPAGTRHTTEPFLNKGNQGIFWSSSLSGSAAWTRQLYYNYAQAKRGDNNKGHGFSVRCIKNYLESNQPPNQPTNPQPSNGSTNITIDTTLSWSCTDPDNGDFLRYDVYFGLESNPPLVSAKQSDTTYNPGALYNDSIYYWKVVAFDMYNDSAVGPVWSFTTSDFTCESGNFIFNGTEYGTVLHNSRCWLDRNLGASQVAAGSADPASYGYLYQWGRATEGHQNRSSAQTSTNATTPEPNAGNSWDGLYILETSSPYDWLTPQDNTLWQGVSGTNNPCPSGYRLPTEAEWNAERLSWSSNNAAGAFASPLKLPVAGSRNHSNGSLSSVGSFGYYWSSTVDGTNARGLYFSSSNAVMFSYSRAYGFSVRCLKDQGTTNQAPEASNVNFSGTLEVGEILTGSYTYTDNESDPEGTSLYQWYRADDASGTNQAAISGATSLTYTLQAADETYYIAFEVTPVAQTGASPGTAVMSAYQGPVTVVTVPSVTNPTTGETWMDRNLGASQVATSGTDAAAYGDLYQWGRAAEGHQVRTSGATSTNATTAAPNLGNPWDGLFITETSSPYDWLTPQDNTLWQGVSGTNNPCPSGYRLPTEAEWEAERTSWSSNDAAGAFASPLKLPVAGLRYNSYGTLANVGSDGYYWSSTVDGAYARGLYFGSSNAGMSSYFRATGFSVRCIQDQGTTNQAPEASNVNFSGTLEVGEILTGSYTYTDNESDPEGTSTYQWYRADDASGTNQAAISGATSLTYTLQAADETYYIAFEVIPVAQTGASPGTAVMSAYQGPVTVVTVPSVTNPTTGETWMDRNLGASQVATSGTDAAAYGDLYQWGRGTDGHEKRNSGTTTTLSSTDNPGHGNFILAPSSPYDWRNPQNNNLWQGVSGTNNPCPSGYRLPTQAEWNAERLSWSSNNSAGAFASPLKLPVAGNRRYSNGTLNNVGSHGYYWSSTVDGTYARRLYFFSSNADVNSNYRAYGLSVRCLKD